MAQKKSAASITNQRVTIVGLSRVLDVPANTLATTVFRVANTGAGEYYMHDILRALWALRKGNADDGGDPGDMTIEEAKRQKTIEEHRKLKLKNDVDERVLIRWADVRSTLMTFIEPATRELKNFLLNKLPSQAQGQTAGEIRNLVTPAYNDWCQSFHDLAEQYRSDDNEEGDEVPALDDEIDECATNETSTAP
jgi:hypothetical protein